MKTRISTRERRKAGFYAALASLTFCGIFFLVPLGSFTIWITVGATLYFLFMTIYTLVPYAPPASRKTGRRVDPKEEEMRAYIRRHLSILATLFAISVFLVLMFLWLVP